MTVTKRTRCWRPQIGLRRLLILWSVAGVGFGWFAYHYRTHVAEQKAIANIRERTTSFALSTYHPASTGGVVVPLL